MVIVLTSGPVTLTLSADASGWCKVQLAHAGQLLQLGADTKSVVIERLMQGLLDELRGQSSGLIDGINVTWVLSLAERHTSIYAAQHEHKKLLFFQDADGKVVARIELTDEDRQRWLRELESRK